MTDPPADYPLVKAIFSCTFGCSFSTGNWGVPPLARLCISLRTSASVGSLLLVRELQLQHW
ncbi:hypothetical protein FIBSPDRAFT_859790 [Athelia psychrophila]|uniref:Uncharacterized protein n=1 Tax=Athelia psychrophila TaxID=1759441 RepID=A0A166KS46_9AGAM|nr:hypothetical protein FIBSPDRAFT_859790 [Fibularhizoctonia sp. CBS 109695]